MGEREPSPVCTGWQTDPARGKNFIRQFVSDGLKPTHVFSFSTAAPAYSCAISEFRLCAQRPNAGRLSEIVSNYKRPFLFFRLRSLLCLAQCSFPLLAGVVLIALHRKDGVGNFEVVVGWATEAGCIAGTGKLLRWGFADWAKERSGHISISGEKMPQRPELALRLSQK